jgi:hypothetical protein
MRRIVMPGLIALAASTIYVHAAPPSAPAAQSHTQSPTQSQQPFRKLNHSRIGPWEVAWIGNDQKVNHCALTRGTSSADLKPGEPKFLMIVDETWMILRVRDASFKFAEKKQLAVTATTAEGIESRPPAATGGPDLADIRFSAEPKERDALLATRHLDIRMDETTTRLSFSGLAAAKAEFDQCMANIGTPAQGFSKDELDEVIRQVKRGTAKCTENKRTRVTSCDVD